MTHYVIFHGTIPVDAVETLNFLAKGQHYETPNDWKSFAQVTKIARLLSVNTGRTFLPVDHGSHTSPRYGIVEPPKVGDAVSYSFNGDSYPDGYVEKITKTFQITTTTGHKYLRRKLSANWLRTGGTWSLIPGHVYEQNPSF
jgi:hypothetical protein